MKKIPQWENPEFARCAELSLSEWKMKIQKIEDNEIKIPQTGDNSKMKPQNWGKILMLLHQVKDPNNPHNKAVWVIDVFLMLMLMFLDNTCLFLVYGTDE